LQVPEKTIEKYLNHENAHAIEAIQAPTTELRDFKIRIIKEDDESITIEPSISTKTIRHSLGKIQELQDIIEINQAPEIWGDVLSKGDKAKIQAAQTALNKLQNEQT